MQRDQDASAENYPSDRCRARSDADQGGYDEYRERSDDDSGQELDRDEQIKGCVRHRETIARLPVRLARAGGARLDTVNSAGVRVGPATTFEQVSRCAPHDAMCECSAFVNVDVETGLLRWTCVLVTRSSRVHLRREVEHVRV